MSKEKVAFLYPSRKDGQHDTATALLVYDAPSFPFTLDINFHAYFLGFSHNTAYWITYEIYKDDSDLDEPISKKGLWLRAKGNPGDEDLSAAAGLKLSDCQFKEPGHYFIQATIYLDKIAVHKNKAYFKVDLNNE
ncbi:hypothetical protein ACX3OY_17295 [Citrobacter farmeri]|nr:hypothetical protein [Citrobacter amalonaticus]